MISDLPTVRLWWLLMQDEIAPPLRGAIVGELLARIAGPPASGDTPEFVDELVAAGLHTLARKHHPDVGGDTTQMQAVNAAAEWLRGQAGR